MGWCHSHGEEKSAACCSLGHPGYPDHLPGSKEFRGRNPCHASRAVAVRSGVPIPRQMAFGMMLMWLLDEVRPRRLRRGAGRGIAPARAPRVAVVDPIVDQKRWLSPSPRMSQPAPRLRSQARPASFRASILPSVDRSPKLTRIATKRRLNSINSILSSAPDELSGPQEGRGQGFLAWIGMGWASEPPEHESISGWTAPLDPMPFVVLRFAATRGRLVLVCSRRIAG
jgi:hypothetical protein